MDDVKPTLESAGFVVAATSYGQFGVSRFLAPFQGRRKEAIERVASDIRTAIRSYKLTHGGADPKSNRNIPMERANLRLLTLRSSCEKKTQRRC